jgi:flagellar biosynthesis protein FlhB
MTLVLFLWWYPHNWKDDWREMLESTLNYATHHDITAGTPVFHWVIWRFFVWAGPSMAMVWVVAIAGSFASGGFVVAPGALAPKPQRLILDRFQDETNNDTIRACQGHDISIGNSSRKRKQ